MSLSKLYKFFLQTIRSSFYDLGIRNAEIIEYIATLLTHFARAESLYKIRELQGRTLTTVVEMLLEAASSHREIEIKKHIGDYTLFMTGMFREYTEKHGFLGFYLQEGSKAYLSISYLSSSNLFLELGKYFEFYSGALDYMKKIFFNQTVSHDPFIDFTYQISKYLH